MTFAADIHVSLRMNYNDLRDPLTFHMAPSSGQNLNSSNTLIYDQIPVKLMTSPSASDALFVWRTLV